MADSLGDPLLNRSAAPVSEPAPPAAHPGPEDAASSAAGGGSGSGTTGGTSGTAGATRSRRPAPGEQLSEAVQMVKDYARQETIDPLKTAGRWIGLGLAGAVLIGTATFFLALGLLRMVQTEWPGTFHGRWMSLMPYAFALLLCVVIAVLAMLRINKKPLTKEER